ATFPPAIYCRGRLRPPGGDPGAKRFNTHPQTGYAVAWVPAKTTRAKRRLARRDENPGEHCGFSADREPGNRRAEPTDWTRGLLAHSGRGFGQRRQRGVPLSVRPQLERVAR